MLEWKVGFMASRGSMKMTRLLDDQTRGDGGHGVNEKSQDILGK